MFKINHVKGNLSGSREIKNPYPEEIKCIVCGGTTEIWTDEPETVCKTCGGAVSKGYAYDLYKVVPCRKECVGAEKYERLIRALKD